MYHTPTFFQSVLLEDAEQASARLVVPSLAFTVFSALSALYIARSKTPFPTLYCSQIILLLGTCCLMLMAAAALSGAYTEAYSLILAVPVAGASMLAPSALLALLNCTNDETHAAATSSFIMARSLGVLAATAAGTTILQNSLRFAITSLDMSSEDLQVRILLPRVAVARAVLTYRSK